MKLVSSLLLTYVLGLLSPRVNSLCMWELSEQASLLVRPKVLEFQQGGLLGTGSGHHLVSLEKQFLKATDSAGLTSAPHGEKVVIVFLLSLIHI